MKFLWNLIYLQFMLVLGYSSDEKLCTTPQYVNLGDTAVIECFFQENVYGIYWYNSTDSSNTRPLVVFENLVKSGDEYKSGKYDVFANGSLIINNVSLRDDHYFRLLILISPEDDPVTANVRVYVVVPPDPPGVVVQGCEESVICVLEVKDEGNLTCSVRRVRPKVELIWLPHNEDGWGNISFFDHKEISTQYGVTYDVSVTSHFKIHDVTQKKFAVECKVSGWDNKIVSLDERVELHLTNGEVQNDNNNGTAVSTPAPWITLTAITIVIITVIVVPCVTISTVYKRRKTERPARTECSMENLEGDEEGQGLLTPLTSGRSMASATRSKIVDPLNRAGISSKKQTAHVQAENLNILDAVRYDWKEEAQFFGINEGDHEDCLAKLRKLEEGRLKETKTILDDLARLKQKGVHYTDDTVKSKLNHLRKTMDVSKKQWVKTYDNKTLGDMISTMMADLQDLGKIAERRPEYNTSEILANASAGLALKGVLVCEDFKDGCVKRVVLNTPTDVKLMNPSLCQIDDVVHFSSKAQSDHFHKILDTMGYSLAVSANGRGRWFQAEGFFKIEGEGKAQDQYHKQIHFESREAYSVVPTASCELNLCNLHLTPQALQHLKSIDKLLVGNKNPQLVSKRCEDFLTLYGSHINAGVLHFGGVYKLEATYTSEFKSKSDNTKCMLQDALSAYASATYSGFGSSMGGSVSADIVTTQDSFTADNEKSEQAKISLHASRNGGPQEVRTFPLWKMGLVTCNRTWVLIDRGKTFSKCFVGIWKLIPYHKDAFRDPCELATSLKTAWEKMSGYSEHNDQDHKLVKGIHAMDLLMEKIATWNAHTLLPERCTGYLQQVLTTVEEMQTLTGTNKYWVNKLCTEIDISRFLENVVDLKDKFSTMDTSMIQFVMRRLVSTVGFNEFRGKQNIIKWADVNLNAMDFPSILDSADIKNITDLISNVKDKFVPALLREHTKNANGNVQVSDSIAASATFNLQRCVLQLLKDLQSREKSHEFFFLKVALLTLHYHWPTMMFKTLLTVEKLQNFVQCTEKLWKEFEIKREEGMVRLEAFLIHILLIYGEFDERNEASEHEFSEIVKDFRQVMSSQLNNVLNRYVTHSPFNWVDMKKVARELENGNMSVLEEREVSINDLTQVLRPHARQSQEQVPAKPGTPTPTRPAQGAFSDILRTLGLEEYYPSKISLTDAMAIRALPEQPKLVDLPWILIRKLLMIDVRARDQLFSVVEQSKSTVAAIDGEDLGLDDFLCQKQGPSRYEETATYLNTLDVMVTLFTCCDNFVKQTLAQKLFMCKLAIPFLYPVGSEDKIAMSLWALRSITVQWHDREGQYAETPVTESPIPLVTFVRLSRPPISKSKLMNHILRDDIHHTFFNHDCYNGYIERRLTDGLVECSWFVSREKQKEYLPCTTMFANLRGDASSLEKQMLILQEISSVLFVIVTARDIAKEPNTKTCKQILQSNAKVILFLMSGSKQQSGQDLFEERKACIDAVGRDLLRGVRIISSSTNQGIHKNASDLKNEIGDRLSEVIAELPAGKIMEECAQIAAEGGIIVDEYDNKACCRGKNLAKHTVSHVEGTNLVDCKKVYLPLQGAEWMAYCRLVKKEHRLTTKGSQLPSAYQRYQLKQDIDHLREKQVKIFAKSFNPFIKEFLLVLRMEPDDVVMYFLQWIKALLDAVSRFELPALRRQYVSLWNQVQKAKKRQEKIEMKQLTSQMDVAEVQLASASFGLENLFRELGQLYEAVKGSGKVLEDTRIAVDCLPDIAAKLLMKGTPLELLDGDASSVPISWVTAVLRKLEDFIGDEKLFVLSVLGTQSSGKSTLLNTMFGLQLAVNAGRCTRGAYMQLIPVDEKAGLPFRYIVVVDSQGLRAPELENLKHEHDNELATLVIGLGDLTILNIKGENTAEIKDVLQIAVHAFLRMKLVSKHIKDHRTCIFVHQNVSAVNAEELMMPGCQKLQQNLDDMANEAANSENIADINSFSQIINFDVQKHVWYFPDLWYGNPPMAPANPGYSEKVEAVILNLLGVIAKEQTTVMTVSDFSIRLDNLWEGILADDFVFSFRNSLEVKAYNNMQSTYYTIEWDLQNELRSWLEEAENKLRILEDIPVLESSCKSFITDLHVVLIEIFEKKKTDLLDYFETNNLQEIVIQWQQSKLNQLSSAMEQQRREGRAVLSSVKEARKVDLLQSQKWSKNDEIIMTKAVELADQLKGKTVNETELENSFETMWTTLLQGFVTTHEDIEVKIDEEMHEVLRARFYSHAKLLQDELDCNPLNQPLQVSHLEGSIGVHDIEITDHISLKRTLWKMLQGIVVRSNLELQAKIMTLKVTNDIFREIDVYLNDLTSQDTKVQKPYALKVIQILVDKIGSHSENENCTFKILYKYIVKLAVHVSRHCVQVFSLMQDRYRKRHGVKAKLEEYKNTAWSLFKNMVKQSTEEVIAADLLCTKVKEIIEKVVEKKATRACIDEVMRDFQMIKYNLILKIMDDLAYSGNFKEYRSYIINAKQFAVKWVTRYTNDKMFSTQNGSGLSRYAQITKSHILKIVRCVAQSVDDATSEVEKDTGMMTQWIETFCRKVSTEIAIPASTLKNMSVRQVVDYKNLQRIIQDQLDVEVQVHLENVFAKKTEDSVVWDGAKPSYQILEKMWGCPEQCPFCEEPCADTTADHHSNSKRSHMCVQHRPLGIGGKRWMKDAVIDGVSVCEGQLAHETCNNAVHSNVLFNCSSCKFECRSSANCTHEGPDPIHSFCEYKTILPSWDIAPDPTNNVSKYWMWFMANYQSQLKDMHKAQLPNLPSSWGKITRQEALDDLRKFHH